ncbi:uncharacterized protein IL334_000338 [Kwoniella shivajii]|uniref:Uncharacterized protein n=1 Tax=Kwoniella shivajii TaxID=564305 RepID=A0ABZ1CPF9_9TREE|nr:hypothetical protein IL334_000338 [Kwoniella shivajii]
MFRDAPEYLSTPRNDLHDEEQHQNANYNQPLNLLPVQAEHDTPAEHRSNGLQPHQKEADSVWQHWPPGNDAYPVAEYNKMQQSPQNVPYDELLFTDPPPPYSPDSSQTHEHNPREDDKLKSYHQEKHLEQTLYKTYRPKGYKLTQNRPQIQVITQPPESKSQVSDTMQMIMMQQMMMQQMQAQQMQTVQMATMNQQNKQMQSTQIQNHQQSHGSNGPCKQRKNGGSINIQNCQQNVKHKMQGKRRHKAIIKPKFVGATAPQAAIAVQRDHSTIDTVAMDNWQEATLILCFAVVGLIYLICARAGGEEKKEDLAKKHMS